MPRHGTATRRRPTRAQREALRRRGVKRREHRVRRFALLLLVAIVAVVTLALTAFNESSAPRVSTIAPAPAQRLLPAQSPQPVVIAKLDALRLQLPIPPSRVTAIGFHAADDGALALQPVGRQANEGLLARLGHALFGGGGHGVAWYQIAGGQGPHTGGLDVGAAPGTAVYSPVDGRIVGVTPYIVDGRKFGNRIDIQPASAPSMVVSLTHIAALPQLAVGSDVSAAETRLATVSDLSGVEQQALARYTNDAGNHVAVEVFPASGAAQ